MPSRSRLLLRKDILLIDFNEYYYFAQIVESGGITSASKVLNLPKSKISKKLTELERRLGVRLIQRTPRSFIVTDIGNEFYEHASKILEEARAAESAVKMRLFDQCGTIRLSSSAQVSHVCLAKILPGFLRRFPQIRVVLDVLNGSSELANRMSDLLIVAHDRELAASSMIQRRLLIEPHVLVASSDYLGETRPIDTPGDLASHQLLGLGEASAKPQWEVVHERTGEHALVPLTPQIATSDIFALTAAARAGAGVAVLPVSVCGEDIRAERLTHLLPEWTAGATTISALLPSRQGVLPTVRALLNHCVEHFPAAVPWPTYPGKNHRPFNSSLRVCPAEASAP